MKTLCRFDEQKKANEYVRVADSTNADWDALLKLLDGDWDFCSKGLWKTEVRDKDK
jgi:hypothetical protein|tara:strand:+ start:60 stop:227 length:168 start_codon:yes stop_codon:yes gene_type:complete